MPLNDQEFDQQLKGGPFVLSVEGPAYMDRGTYTTHKVLGVFNSEEEARSSAPVGDDETIVLITDIATGKTSN